MIHPGPGERPARVGPPDVNSGAPHMARVNR